MKKMICILMTAALLALSAGSLAGGVIPNLKETPTETPSAAVFSFRGGVQWNMTRELVKALESIELTERNQESWSILFPLSKVDVSRYQADLVYMFYNDRLKMISYDFGAGGTEADFQYLTGALDTVYGDHTEPAASDIVGIMDQIYPGYYSAENLMTRRGWAAQDTLIYLYYYAQNAYAILYVNAAGSTGSYVTTGL